MKISPFQIAILAFFGVSLSAGLLVLATTKSKGQGSGVPVVIWGTLSADNFNEATEALVAGGNGLKIIYIEKRPENFDQGLLEALASGTGPDVIVLPQDLIMRHRD